MHTRRSIRMLCAHFLYPLSFAFAYGLVSKRLRFCLTANHYCCSLKEQKNKNAINGHPSKLFVVSPKYGVHTLTVVYNMLIHIKPKVDTFLITFSPSTLVLLAIQFGLDVCCCTWFVRMIWRIDNAKCLYVPKVVIKRELRYFLHQAHGYFNKFTYKLTELFEMNTWEYQID